MKKQLDNDTIYLIKGIKEKTMVEELKVDFKGYNVQVFSANNYYFVVINGHVYAKSDYADISFNHLNDVFKKINDGSLQAEFSEAINVFDYELSTSFVDMKYNGKSYDSQFKLQSMIIDNMIEYGKKIGVDVYQLLNSELKIYMNIKENIIKDSHSIDDIHSILKKSEKYLLKTNYIKFDDNGDLTSIRENELEDFFNKYLS